MLDLLMMELPRLFKYFSDVHYSDSKFASSDDPFKMHETRHVSSCDNLCAMTHMVVNAIFTHAHGNRLLGYRKRTAEAATFIRSFEFDELKVLYLLQKAARLVEVFGMKF
jgi:hypothetical protein